MKYTNKQKSIKHNYTNELELKTLIIRINNAKKDIGVPDKNKRIDELVNTFAALNEKAYVKQSLDPKRRAHIKSIIKERAIEDSVQTAATQAEEERLGNIIILMTKHILTKPKFSGYTYKDDFYSDASYKILKYLHNFNHTLISERTGVQVNSFAYISQIIHNSIVYIIKKQKKENQKVRSYAETKGVYEIPGFTELYKESNGIHPASACVITKYFYLSELPDYDVDTIQNEVKSIMNKNEADNYVFVCSTDLDNKNVDIIKSKFDNIEFEVQNDE